MASMLVRASRGAATARAAASAASRCAAAALASSCVGSGGGGVVAVSYRLLILRGLPLVASSPRFGRAGLSSYCNSDDDNMSFDEDEFYDLDCHFHVDEGDDDESNSESYDSDDSDGEERVPTEVVHSAKGARCKILGEQDQKDEDVVAELREAIK